MVRLVAFKFGIHFTWEEVSHPRQVLRVQFLSQNERDFFLEPFRRKEKKDEQVPLSCSEGRGLCGAAIG